MNVQKIQADRVERYEAYVPVKEYLTECVDVSKFLEYCRQCPNYNTIWSCPEYDFDPYEFWNKFEQVHFIGCKIYAPKEIVEKTWTKEEQWMIIDQLLWPQKRVLTKELLQMEKDFPEAYL